MGLGLQSFGEGIDLPGALCEHVVIDKLAFTPPNSPVEEALAEWLSGQGRDTFAEIALPRATMKLAQWAGRGVLHRDRSCRHHRVRYAPGHDALRARHPGWVAAVSRGAREDGSANQDRL